MTLILISFVYFVKQFGKKKKKKKDGCSRRFIQCLSLIKGLRNVSKLLFECSKGNNTHTHTHR